MQDIFKVKGHFKLESIKDGVSKVEVEDDNLIVTNASVLMAKIISGATWNSSNTSVTAMYTVPYVNKITFGILGHNTSNPTQVRTDWPVPSRTSLYSSAYDQPFSPTLPPILPDPTTGLGSLTISSEAMPGNQVGNKIWVSRNNNVIQYVITMPKGNGNANGGFSEAALWVGTDMFAMKCFPWKPKDSQTDWKITWTITL